MKNVRSTKHDSKVWHHRIPNSVPDSGHFWNQNIEVWTWITVFCPAVIKKPTAPWDSAHQEVLSGVIKTELNFSLHRHFKGKLFYKRNKIKNSRREYHNDCYIQYWSQLYQTEWKVWNCRNGWCSSVEKPISIYEC